IQNAHDSIARRTVLAAEATETGPAAQIRVVTDPVEQTIAISDNGTGLTRTEIDDYLSTIGQFGIGLLSAFIVAERVSLVTKAAGHEALRWESEGGETYRVSPAERAHVGTTVTLHLRPEHSRYLETGRLR